MRTELLFLFVKAFSVILLLSSVRDLIKPYVKRLPYPCPDEEMKKLADMGTKKIKEYIAAYEESQKINASLKRKFFPFSSGVPRKKKKKKGASTSSSNSSSNKCYTPFSSSSSSSPPSNTDRSGSSSGTTNSDSTSDYTNSSSSSSSTSGEATSSSESEIMSD